MKRLLLPLAAFLALAAASLSAPGPASAEHCNGKACVGNRCQTTTGGPSPHCIESGATCAWDYCSVT